jgi:hypothetical protein
MARTMRPTTWTMLVSAPRLPSGWGTPALRQYFEARMSVAVCDQVSGTSTLSMRQTTDPSGFLISLVRWTSVADFCQGISGVV